jgi:hypothetical protein
LGSLFYSGWVNPTLSLLSEHDLVRKPIPTPDQVEGKLFGIMLYRKMRT